MSFQLLHPLHRKVYAEVENISEQNITFKLLAVFVRFLNCSVCLSHFKSTRAGNINAVISRKKIQEQLFKANVELEVLNVF